MMRVSYGSRSASIVAKIETGTPIRRNGCQPTRRVSSRGTSTAACQAWSAWPWPSIQSMTGRTRFEAFRSMNAVLSATQTSANAVIVQNLEPERSVYRENRPTVARQTMNAETNSKAT